MNLVLPWTPRHEFPPNLRRQHTLNHIRQWGLEALPQHPVPYQRWEPRKTMLVSLCALIALGAILGLGAVRDGAVYFLFPLGGIGLWVILCGPVFLPRSIVAARRKRRVSRAVQKIPAWYCTDYAIHGYSGSQMGIVTYGDGWIRLITTEKPAVEVPFSAIFAVEELPPKGFSVFSGIDVLSKSGEWTEIRMTDNKEILFILERAGVPVVRAVNELRP